MFLKKVRCLCGADIGNANLLFLLFFKKYFYIAFT